MEEKQLSEIESLQLITEMIGRAKNSYYESGFGSLLWGFTNFICFVLSYFYWGTGQLKLPFNPFWLMIPVFIIHLYYANKEKQSRPVKNYEADVHDFIWSAFGIAVLITTVAGGFGKIGYWVMPFLLVLFGMPTYISGRILKSSSLTVGGIVCWLLSIIAFLLPEAQQAYGFLLVAAGAAAAWIIPGFILRRKYLMMKRSHHV